MPTLKGFSESKGGAYSAKSVAPFRVATDPKPRDDGRCIGVDCNRMLPRIAKLHDDPFCSTVCCRNYYEAQP